LCQHAAPNPQHPPLRPTLKRFHQLVVHIDGTVSSTGKGWWTEVLDDKVLSQSSSAAQLQAISAAGGQRP
jgi:hypothetical protein